MRAVIQRVKRASVEIDGTPFSSIGKGLLVFLGIASTDKEDNCSKLVKKILGLRIFEDRDGKMNLSNEDINGEYLIVSQFTLLADLSKGKRPGFDYAMRPPQSELFYQNFCKELQQSTLCRIKTGKFGENMVVKIENDGPATFIIDLD